MKYLVIDCTLTQPIRGVVDDCGRHVGTTQLLDWGDELRDYAKWVGLHGGMLMVWPVDAEGEPLHDECEAVEIRHHDDRSHLVWEAKLNCDLCCGHRHHNLHGEPVQEEDLCLSCDGNGFTIGAEFETDMDGGPLTPTFELSRPAVRARLERWVGRLVNEATKGRER
jgi:hypothetical protein